MKTDGKPVVFISGKMRGVPYFNFPAFDAARDRLEALGFGVLSPADLDRAAGFDPEIWASSFDLTLGDGPDWDKIPRGFDLVAAVNRDNAAIESADAVFVLREGVGTSEGSAAEILLAVRLGKRILTDAMSDREVVAALGGSWELVPGPYRCEVPPESNGWADVMRGEVEMCTCFAYDAAERAAKIADALNAQAARRIPQDTPSGTAAEGLLAAAAGIVPCFEETPGDASCPSAKTST